MFRPGSTWALSYLSFGKATHLRLFAKEARNDKGEEQAVLLVIATQKKGSAKEASPK